MRYKPKNVAALHLALGAYRIECGSMQTNRPGFPQGPLANFGRRQPGPRIGDNDPAGSPSRKCRDGEQGRRQTSRAKTIGSGSS